MYAASTKQAGNLSQSALSYLQSLESATKALRQNQHATEKKSGTSGSIHESSRLSSERGSLSTMISELRQKQARRESIIDESDDDKSTTGRPSNRSGKPTSSGSSSSAGGERIMFDFPFDSGSKKNDNLPLELPDLQVGRKSLSELRELRTSIDHSLIKPPRLQRQQQRRPSTASQKESFDDPQDDSEVEELQLAPPKPNPVKQKSPFRAAIESGSDLESLDFEEDLPKPKSVRFEENTKEKSASSRSASSRRSSTRSSSSSSQSRSTSKSTTSASSASSSSTPTVSSKASSTTRPSKAAFIAKESKESVGSGSSTIRDYESDFESGSTQRSQSELESNPTSSNTSIVSQKEAVLINPELHREDHDENPEPEKVRSTERFDQPSPPIKLPEARRKKSAVYQPAPLISSLPLEPRKRSEAESLRKVSSAGNLNRSTRKLGSPSRGTEATKVARHDEHSLLRKVISEHGTQTEERQERLVPEFCSANVHHLTKDVFRTHLQLLKEFNRLEWSSLQEWNSILDDIREKYDGPSTQKLKAIIDKRAVGSYAPNL